MERPTIPGSRPKRVVQSRWLKTAARPAPGASSPSAKVLPSGGVTPRTRKNSAETRASRSRSGNPDPVRLTASYSIAAMPSRLRLRSWMSQKFGPVKEAWFQPRSSRDSQMDTRRSGSRNGSGRNSTVSTTLKIAALAPMPRPMVNTATAAKPGFLRRVRTLKRRSRKKVPIDPSSLVIPPAARGEAGIRGESRYAEPRVPPEGTLRPLLVGDSPRLRPRPIPEPPAFPESRQNSIQDGANQEAKASQPPRPGRATSPSPPGLAEGVPHLLPVARPELGRERPDREAEEQIGEPLAPAGHRASPGSQARRRA